MYGRVSHRSRAFKLILLLSFISVLAGSSWAATFTVTKIEDTNDGVCDTDCSLREAVEAANAAATDDVIVFDPNVFSTPRTIILSGTEIAITGNGSFRLEGPGASLLTISGNNASGVLSIGSSGTAEIDGVTISDGNLPEGYGAGITNRGNLTLSNSIVTRNSSYWGGGGIHSYGRLQVIDSVLSENTSGWGGGILNDGLLSIERSTISGNSAVWGGGIANFANMTVVNSTISGNSAIGDSSRGGGIFNESNAIVVNTTIAFNGAANGGGFFHDDWLPPSIRRVDLRNTIISNNISTVSGPDFRGPLESPSYNLIGDTAGTMISGSSTGNILDQDPMLDPRLLMNGGSTPNHALRKGSPAIDAGSTPSLAGATDQRGFQRPFDFPLIPNASGGDGSDIGAFERQADDVSGLEFVSISGRVMTPDGRGLRNATVTIFDAQGFRSTVITSSLGYYTFENIRADATHTIAVISKRYRFAARDVIVDGDLTELDFIGSE
jgi:CSLREA domain-containing protein